MEKERAEDKSLMDRLRDTGVGLEDPNIAGDPEGDDDDGSAIEVAEPGEESSIQL